MAYQPKSYRKFVATAATATLVASAVTPAFAASVEDFKDVNSNYKEAVQYLVDNEIAQGTSETTFGTDNSITRGDAAIMIANALKLDVSDAPEFEFTDLNSRVKNAVNALYAEGIINGKTETTFAPAANITRAEMAKIIARAYDLKAGDTKNEFTDVNSNFDEYVDALVANNITLGKTEKLFGATQNVTRGEFALFVFRADTEIGAPDKLKVASVQATTADDLTTVTATVENAPAGAEAKIEVFANGATTATVTKTEKVVEGKVAAEFPELPVGTHTVKVTVGEATAQSSFTVAAPAVPVVQSVSAANANEIKVTFNTELDEATAENAANYTLSKTRAGSATGNPANWTATLLDDKKTVLLSSTNAGVQSPIFVNGDYFTLEVKNVLSSKLQKVTDYKTGIITFFDKETPTVQAAALDGNSVRVYFNEPVTNVSLKVDGGATTSATSVNKDGKYYAQIAATDDMKKAGVHTVTVYGATDANSNKLDVATVQYTAVSDTAAPTVQSITANGQYGFKVKFSEKLAGTPATSDVTVVKGSLELPVTGISLDSSDPTDTTYAVTVTDASATNKVYATGENTANLSVKVKNYKDTSNLIGSEYNGSVTLTRDNAGPTVVSSNLNTVDASADTVRVKFNENLVNVDPTKITVLNKDGVAITGTNASIVTDSQSRPRDVLITLGSHQVEPGTYTVRFNAGALTDASANNNVALTTTAVYSVSSTNIGPSDVTVSTTGKNTFQVTYASGTDLTASATNAANYKLDGVTLPSNTDISFVGNKKAVQIELPQEYVPKSTTGLLTVTNNVVNEAGQSVYDSSANKEVSKSVTLTDNVKPKLVSGKFVVSPDTATTTQTIELTFDENMGTTGTNDLDDYQVVINGSEVTPAGITFTSGSDRATLTFASVISINQAVTVKVLNENDQTDKDMDATDAAGNKLTGGTSVTVSEKK